MRQLLHAWTAGLATAISLAIISCAYDPYQPSAGGYYGEGYGYGSSIFSTSRFVATGDPRWGYDPYSYCYYDYRSHRYYDPYLYGYYPVGYRPHAVSGAPHPHVWRPGSGHCPPPRTVRDVSVVNYRDREAAYRKSNYSWAKELKHRPPSSGPRSNGRTSPSGYRTNPAPRHHNRNPQVRPLQGNRAPQAPLYSSGGMGRDDRSTIRPSPRQVPRSDSAQSTRQYRPEPPRGQPMQRPQSSRQFERPQAKPGRGGNQPRMQTPPSYQPKQKNDLHKMKPKSLRSLGEG